MHVVIVRLRIRPGKTGEFLQAIRANAAATRAEPGCLRFDVLRDAEDPDTFWLYEIYRDAEAFHTEHRSAPHYRPWRQAAAEFVVPGEHTNFHAVPVFPADMPEQALLPGPKEERAR